MLAGVQRVHGNGGLAVVIPALIDEDLSTACSLWHGGGGGARNAILKRLGECVGEVLGLCQSLASAKWYQQMRALAAR